MSDDRSRSPADDSLMAQPFDHRRRATAEEREFLEALVFLRGLYAERGPRDRAPIASVNLVIAETERRMRGASFGASA